MSHKSAKLGVTNFGILALLLAMALNVPVLLSDYLLPYAGLRLTARIENNLGYIVFDFGVLIDLIVLVLALLGISQGGWNRWAASFAIAIAAIPWALPLIV